MSISHSTPLPQIPCRVCPLSLSLSFCCKPLNGSHTLRHSFPSSPLVHPTLSLPWNTLLNSEPDPSRTLISPSQAQNHPLTRRSIAARNFSDDLDSLFGLNSGTTLGNLSFTVEEKSVSPSLSYTRSRG